MSSLSRAFTTRRNKLSIDQKNGDGLPQRSNTTKGQVAGSSIRSKISGPVQLIHTTNMLSYEAPDLFPKKSASPLASPRSDDESDSHTTRSSTSTPPTSPDTPFPEKRSGSPEPNHLSCYFMPPNQVMDNAPALGEAPPQIPKRAPSHTKKNYDSLGRNRSISRASDISSRTLSTKASFTFSRSSSASTSASTVSSAPQHSLLSRKPSGNMGSQGSLATITATTPQYTALAPAPAVTAAPTPAPSTLAYLQNHRKEYSDSHPFGQELAQVSELVEEIGIKEEGLSEMEQEEKDMRVKGLCIFSAADYLSDVQSLSNSFFPRSSSLRQAAPAAALWI